MDESVPLLGRISRHRAPSPWYAIITMILVAFSGGALYAPHTQYYTEVFCSRYYNNNIGDNLIPFKNCAIPEIQKMVSRAQAVIMLLSYGSTLIGAAYYGRLSDLKGRRLILRISSLGSVIYVTCDLITAKYYKTIGISLLFIGPLIRGILAGESVLMMAVQAYISDCTSPLERTVVFAQLMASLFIGSAVGPFVSSLVLKHSGSIVNVFCVAFIVDLINLLFTNFIVPESNDYAIKRSLGEIDSTVMTSESMKPIKIWENLNVFSALNILFKDPPPYMTRYALPFVALAEFLLTLVKRPPTLLYAMLKFKWTAYEGSVYYTYASLMKLFMMIIVLPLLSKLFLNMCPKIYEAPTRGHQENQSKSTALFDIWMVRIGIGVDAVCLALSGLANNVELFVAAGMLQSFSMLAQPSIRALLTTLVEPNRVGELLGAVAILDSISMIISHLGINTIYSLSVQTMPNLTFFVCATIAGCSCLSAFLVRSIKTRNEIVDPLEESTLYDHSSNSSTITNDTNKQDFAARRIN